MNEIPLWRRARRKLIDKAPFLKGMHSAWIVFRWRFAGCPVPPPHIVKRMTVRRYARRFGLKSFVETGTFLGEMVAGTSKLFQKVYSIELDPSLAAKAREMFAADPKIEVMEGDSGDRLAGVLEELDGPALFWLDAHYSEGITARGPDETPILRELTYLLGDQREHVFLIDDARLFVGGAYPSMQQLRDFLYQRRPDLRMESADDIIRIHR